MCQVHTGAYVSLLEPGKTDYTAYSSGHHTPFCNIQRLYNWKPVLGENYLELV